ncbi:chemotaxis protein CheW [Xanthomonadaceae bacterium JHOS43]|nr:chemotaxis protein CheW [Xanthomonadaceae bacterium JHOS43]MCX7562956.1 chemotaxis protein CheW [Xanthomonadaceae bacterium XH05]
MNSSLSQDIRGVMISVTGARVLLPNATVAEVITYSPPEHIEGAPDWMLGRIRWRGWRLPVISYARMIGTARDEGEFGAKVVVLKALGGNPRYSFFALLTQGFPRLVTVSRDALTQEASEQSIDGVLMNVRLRDEEAVIPDLATIEARITEVDSLRVA